MSSFMIGSSNTFPPASSPLLNASSAAIRNARSNAQVEDQWHLPDGRTLHVVADSEGEAGVTYLYENVTERKPRRVRNPARAS